MYICIYREDLLNPELKFKIMDNQGEVHDLDGMRYYLYSVLQCVAVCCSVLQCVAVCCSVLQCVMV